MSGAFDDQARQGKMRRMNLLPQLLRPAAVEPQSAPPKSSEGDAVQRLQIGLIGLGAMVLLVGVADMIMTRAQMTEQSAVPEAAATVEAEPTPSEDNNALETAGVVPDLPKPAADAPVPEGPVLPERGDGAKPAR